jgi:glycosyltransferase involved in cell wall biosynthesis
MKLLVVARVNFNPAVTRWINRLQTLGVTVRCLHIGSAADLGAAAAKLPAPVHYLFPPGEDRKPNLIAMLGAYRDVVRREAPDAVWVFCLWTLVIPLAWVLRWHRLPLILTVCGSDFNNGVKSFRQRQLFRHLLGLCSLVCTTTPEMMAHVGELIALPSERRLVLHWGIDVDMFRPAADEERLALRAKWGIPAEAFVVFTGRIFRPIAYYEEAVSALAKLAAMPCGPAVRAIFVNWASDAAVVEQVERRIGECGLRDSVVVIDRELDGPELREIYAISDVTLNLMKQDQLGSMLFEAMAVDSLIVTTDLPQYVRVGGEGVRWWFVRRTSVEADLLAVLAEQRADIAAARVRAVEHNRKFVRSEYDFALRSREFVEQVEMTVQREAARA